MDYFIRGATPQDSAAAAAAQSVSKLSNGAALTVAELSKEPQRGLVQVADHIQKSVPGLLQTKQDLQRTHAQLKAVLEDLRDASQGVGAMLHPDTHATLASLSTSIQQLQPTQVAQGTRADTQPASAGVQPTAYGGSLSAAAAAMTSSLGGIARLW